VPCEGPTVVTPGMQSHASLGEWAAFTAPMIREGLICVVERLLPRVDAGRDGEWVAGRMALWAAPAASRTSAQAATIAPVPSISMTAFDSPCGALHPCPLETVNLRQFVAPVLGGAHGGDFQA
jgi:hypothetical protein